MTQSPQQKKMSTSSIVSFLILLSGLVSVWVNTQVSIARIDAKVIELELRMKENTQEHQNDLNKLYMENREDHKELKQSVKELGDMISKKRVIL